MKKLRKDANTMIKTGIGLGVGSAALGNAGSVYGQQAIGNISRKLPTMGNIAAVGGLMRGLKGLEKAAKPRKKR